MASFMRQRISPAPGDSKAQRAKDRLGRGKTGQTAPKMPTTTNNRRAYIRRSLIIPWSSQRRSYEASTSPLEDTWRGLGRIARGLSDHYPSYAAQGVDYAYHRWGRSRLNVLI